MAKFVDPLSVPQGLRDNAQRLREKIESDESRLAELEASSSV